MRDVVTGFYPNVLLKLLVTSELSVRDSVLVVCGGAL